MGSKKVEGVERKKCSGKGKGVNDTEENKVEGRSSIGVRECQGEGEKREE